MGPLIETLLTNLGVVLALMFGLWIAGTMRRDVSLVDIFWGPGFVLVSVVSVALYRPPVPRSWLLLALTAAWGLRLSLYLLWRNWGHAEDRRYAAMRAHHGERFWLVSLFTVFLLQGLIMWFVSLPIQATAAYREGTPLFWLDGLGVALWFVGLSFETVGDWQLARFRANPRSAGRVLDRGLWRYTRHPNYFGDFCVWWGMFLVAAGGGAAWTIGSPALMSLLLLRVSGVTLLERTITERRPDYEAYRRRTSAFFPWPPRGE